MADVQIAVIDPEDTQLALAAPAEAVVNVAVPGVQGPIGLTGSVTIAQAGTAATPGIRFESDTNTGIYSPGADQLAVATNGVERVEFGTSQVVFNDGGANYDFRIEGDTEANLVFVDASTDRVGIGTATPQAPFVVSNAGANGIEMSAANEPSIIQSINRATSVYTALSYAGAQHVFTNGSSERVRVTSAGLVGIGTSLPGALLEASSNASSTLNGEVLIQRLRSNASNGVFVDVKSRRHTAGTSWEGVGLRLQHQVDGTGMGFLEFNSLNGGQDVAIGTGGSTRLLVDSLGRVGIGTTSPLAPLHVASAIPTLVLDESDGTSTHSQSWFLRNSNELQIQTRNSTGTFVSIDYNSTGSSTGATSHQWYINNSEVARIDTSGAFLVGTSTGRIFANSAAPLLQIESATLSKGLSITTNRNDSASNVLHFGKSRSAANGGFQIVSENDAIGLFRFEAADGSALIRAAEITCVVDGTPGTNDMPGRLVFSTTADGASSPTERLRITSAGVLQIAEAGNITVGTTTGTKIGTATTQKIGFYNATPVVQPTAVADATDAATVITQLNALLAKLRTLGIIAT